MYLRKKDWDISSLKTQIMRIAQECKSPYNEGFTSFELKKELYELKLILDDQLQKCPTFAGEQEWLQDIEKETIIKHLSK